MNEIQLKVLDLLKEDARSEYRPEFRERQAGGGWQMRQCGVRSDPSGKGSAWVESG